MLGVVGGGGVATKLLSLFDLYTMHKYSQNALVMFKCIPVHVVICVSSIDLDVDTACIHCLPVFILEMYF